VLHIQVSTDMFGTTVFLGVALLTLVAPFELTEPLLRFPRQSVSSLEAAVLCAFTLWGVAAVSSRRLPEWRTPLTLPWLALFLAMAVASAASPVSRINAFHMTGRVGAAFGVYLLMVNGVTTPARLRAVLTMAVAVGVVVSLLAILEYLGVRPVLDWLKAFRPGLTTVGAQLRAGGPLQYPTIASMYLEIVFAFGLGLLLAEHDAARSGRVGALFVALVVIGEAITLTFTRAGLITMAASVVFVGAIRRSQRGVETGGAIVAGVAVIIAGLFFASRSPQSMWLRFTSEGQESWYRAAVEAPAELELPAGGMRDVRVTVTNTGRQFWDSMADPPILLSYHWLPSDGAGFVAFEGMRTSFRSPVAPGAAVTMDVRVRAPRQPGRYRIEWDVVQEGSLWFSTEPGAARMMSRARVSIGSGGVIPAVEMMAPPRVTERPGRGVLWRAAARMFAAHPLLGVGPDNFRLAYGAYAGLASADPRTHSNNMYLEVLAGGGLLVGAVFLWLLWRTGGCFVRAVRLAADRQVRSGGLALGLAAAGLAIALHATVDSFLSFAPTYVLFSLTLGCAVAFSRGAERSDANRV
jgi:O-Antigen ligase